MNKKTIFIITLMACLMFLPMVSATIIQDNSTASFPSNTVVGGSGGQGMKFVVNNACYSGNSCYFVNFTAGSMIDADVWYLFNTSSGSRVLLTTGTVFNATTYTYGVSDIRLYKGTIYDLVLNRTTGSQRIGYRTTSASVTGVYINYTTSDDNGADDGANIRNILSITTSNVNSIIPNVSITLTDFYTGTSISNFSATAINASGYQYNGTTTSGTLNDWTYTFSSTDASLWNITLASTENGGYLTRTLLNQNVSSAITSTLAQSIISFTASEFISNTTLTSINFSTQYLTNTTQYMRAQLYLVNTSKTGYFNKSQNVTVTALSTTTVNIENVTKTRLNLTIKSALTNVTLSNWAVQLNNSVYSYSETQSTTGSNLVIDSITGNWTALVDVSGYALTLANLTLLDGVNNVTLYIYSSESINFFFYNEQTGALILNPNVTIELIGSYASYNRTSSNNGTVYIDILTPDAYVARYYATGFNPRFSYVSVGSRTTQNVSLYLLPSANGTNITITVLQQDGSQVQSALIKVLKYDLASNSYIVRELILTDYAGQAIVDVLYNQEFYKFIVESPVGTIALETDPAYITSSTLTLILDSELAGTLYTYIQNAGGLVTFNTATNNFRFTWSDTNNIVSNACLKVYLLYDNYTANYLGQNCSTASAGTLLYAVSNSTQAQYYAEGWFTLVIGDRKVSEAFADLRTNNYFGLLGVLIAVGLTVTITFIFIKTSTPQVALMSLPLGITVTNLTGITQFASWVPFGLFAVCLVLVVSMGRDK